MKEFDNKTHDVERSSDADDLLKNSAATQPGFVHDRGAFVDLASLLGPFWAELRK